MKITLQLTKPAFDDKRLDKDIISDFYRWAQIYIYKDESNWISDEDESVYSLWVEYGFDKDKAMMFEVKLDDLELFAETLIKSINMFRRDYEGVIREKLKTNARI